MDSPLAPTSPLAPPASPLASTTASPAPASAPAAAPTYDMSNYQAATQQMKLNPQEQALYQMHLQNLHGPGGVDNPDGSRSTLYQTTFELDGKNYVIPTVWGGKILPPDQALQMAKQYGLDKFPAYGSDKEAEARYQQMHKFMEQDTAAYFQTRKQ